MKKFCTQPFRTLEVHAGGKAFACCPSWLPKSIGNLSTQTVEEIWNGLEMQEIRSSILDGSFKYCTDLCPFKNTVEGHVKMVEEIDSKYTEKLPHGPKSINAAFDRSCNLSCPSCRTEKIIQKDKDVVLGFQQKIEECLHDAERLYITGSGDPFGSPYFARWIRTLDVLKYPQLLLHFHTNAQLWTEKRWMAIPEATRARIVSAQISIDAASEETYKINRRGGSWPILLENLAFIGKLRKERHLKWLIHAMVVQENNFHEMPEFVEMCLNHSADWVYFAYLENWGTYSSEEYKKHAVQQVDHPRHAELLEVLKHPILGLPSVRLGDLAPLRKVV